MTALPPIVGFFVAFVFCLLSKLITLLGANSASQMWKLYLHVFSFCTQTGLWQCFSRCLQKGSFSYLQCSACTQSFSSSVEVLCCIFQALGKKKSKGDQIRQIITSLSYFSLSVPPPPPLTVSTFNCNLQPLLHLVSHCSLCLFTVLIRWAGR